MSSCTVSSPASSTAIPAATPIHNGSPAVPGAGPRVSPRRTHGVSSHSPSGKITSPRAASGQNEKPRSHTAHATVATSRAAYSHNASRRRAISSTPVSSNPDPASP